MCLANNCLSMLDQLRLRMSILRLWLSLPSHRLSLSCGGQCRGVAAATPYRKQRPFGFVRFRSVFLETRGQLAGTLSPPKTEAMRLISVFPGFSGREPLGQIKTDEGFALFAKAVAEKTW